ncbi:MAG: cell envelope biogenesis protein OmpA, partial [Robiginitomaculum sp.]
PPPPPPPAPVCNDVAFPVYFDWDKSNLTTQAADAIAAGVARASRCGIASANVGGHADKSGNRKYNVGLSSRRANIVRGELVNRGVSGAVISTEAFGETAPAVQTPDGAREPLNRRAVVVLHAR